MCLSGLAGHWIGPLLLAAALPSIGTAAVAQPQPENRTFAPQTDVDTPPAVRYRLSDTLAWGGRFESELTAETGYNLEDDRPSRSTIWQPANLSLALSWRPGPHLSAYGNLEFDNTLVLREKEVHIDDASRLKLDKLYLDLRQPASRWRLRLGRQRVKNAREWLIDDTLDGIALQGRWRGHRLTLGAWRERAFTENLLRRDPAKRRDQFWFNLSREENDLDRAIYLFGQRYPKREEWALWLGGHLHGERESLDYWLDAAVVTGSRRGKRLEGLGFDAGGVLRLWKRPRLYLIGSIAYGSGNPDDVDRGFRQTGLQDNSAKLGGVIRMAYYGEVLDPELANLWIVTLGAGVRPVRNTSVNLVYHHYRQVHALDELRDTELLTVKPGGTNRDIGHELDLVFGYRSRHGLRLEFVLGRFSPGRAFTGNAETATLIQCKIRYDFG